MFKYCGKIDDVQLDVENNFLDGSEKRVVFGPGNGFSDFMAVRDFRIDPGVVSSPHTHPWAHCITGISGKGSFVIEGESAPIEPGRWCYVPGDLEHYFQNDGDEVFEFQCIVPPEGDVNPNKK